MVQTTCTCRDAHLTTITGFRFRSRFRSRFQCFPVALRIMMTGSGVTVGSTYVDILVTIGTQLSTKQGHSAASVAHAKASSGHSLGVSVTPLLSSGQKATPSALPTGRSMTASNDVLEKKNDQRYSTQGRESDHYSHHSPKKAILGKVITWLKMLCIHIHAKGHP